MPEIRLEKITKFYKQEKRQVAAIRDVDLTVRQGEFLFVTGSSGAGKSTLLRLITGDLQPSSGTVYLDGASRTLLSRRFRERLMFGYVPQIPQLMRRRTIRDNLAAIAMIQGGAPTWADRGAGQQGPQHGGASRGGGPLSGGAVSRRVPPGGAGTGYDQQPGGAGAGRADRQPG